MSMIWMKRLLTYLLKIQNTPEEAPLRSPEEILTEMESLDKETANILESLKALI
jgi:type I restriction enzyme M protein